MSPLCSKYSLWREPSDSCTARCSSPQDGFCIRWLLTCFLHTHACDLWVQKQLVVLITQSRELQSQSTGWERNLTPWKRTVQQSANCQKLSEQSQAKVPESRRVRCYLLPSGRNLAHWGHETEGETLGLVFSFLYVPGHYVVSSSVLPQAPMMLWISIGPNQQSHGWMPLRIQANTNHSSL